MKCLWLIGVLALIKNCFNQIKQIEGPSDHNLMYQFLMMPKESKVRKRTNPLDTLLHPREGLQQLQSHVRVLLSLLSD
jgi:hypothetical protein